MSPFTMTKRVSKKRPSIKTKRTFSKGLSGYKRGKGRYSLEFSDEKTIDAAAYDMLVDHFEEFERIYLTTIKKETKLLYKSHKGYTLLLREPTEDEKQSA
jgi:hypothetical protein